MVIQGIKDRSKIRECMVTRKQGTEMKVKQEKEDIGGNKGRPRDGCPWEEREIWERSRGDP